MPPTTVIDSFPLTPMQHGMLFHRLQAENVGVDVEQVGATLREAIDVWVFEAAWKQLAARHPVLRSRFRWSGLEHPVQEILEEVAVPFTYVDLSALPKAFQQARLGRFFAHDRRAGFELDAAPLFRVALFKIAAEDYRLIWTYAHAILDSCSSVVLEELFTIYEAGLNRTTPKLEQRPAYRDHAVWLQQHLADNRDQGRAFFRDLLTGFETPTQLGALQHPDATQSGYGATKVRLSVPASAALRALGQQQGFRDQTLVETAWALTLSAFSGEEDVVFGSTRACRRSALPGSENTVGLFFNTLPVRVKIDAEAPIASLFAQVRSQQLSSRQVEHTPLIEAQQASPVARGTPLFETLVVANDLHHDTRFKALGGKWLQREFDWHDQTSFPLTLLSYGDPQLHFKLSWDRRRFDEPSIARVAALLIEILEAIALHPERKVSELPRVGRAELNKTLIEWNATQTPTPAGATIHSLFAAQAAKTPWATALCFRGAAITYRELDERSNRLAHQLIALGVGPEVKVGVYVERSIEMMCGLLAILKAGGAYVPMDPAYPQARIAMMLEDSRAPVILTLERLRGSLPKNPAQVVALDHALDPSLPATRPATQGTEDDLAYVIFTSGSTGRPKGAMIRHRNVVNFFCGMDALLEHADGEQQVWLALTSISFDISVLELFWTLTRGFKVVIQEDNPTAGRAALPSPQAGKGMQFSLFYFAAEAAGGNGTNPYRLLLEGAKFADTHDFAAVWTPERHFHAFGGLYPNPAVTSAAIAAVTQRVGIRAGSVVLPLHNPIRCAEEWSVVDNLSNGRIGLSFASGWHASDFALMPENFANRRELMSTGIETVRALFRGEDVAAKSGDGKEIRVKIFPKPVQKAPPIWITAGGSPQTFQMAGTLGANILTNLLVMKTEELVSNIAAYRAAYRAAGHAGEGHITLMLHTFIGENHDAVRAKVRGPFLEYLKTSTDLINKAKWEKTAFARPDQQRAPAEGGRDLSELTPEETDAMMDHAFERYFKSAGLFGTPEGCVATIDRLKGLGIDEVACLIDFGVDENAVLESLTHLDALRRLTNAPGATVEAGEDFTVPAQIRRHRVTHLQCTPSYASVLVSDPLAVGALSGLKKMLLGGEALPVALVDQLRPNLTGDLFNMYGPTETTIWSTAAKVGPASEPITIGRPIANTQIYIVDRHLRPQPVGVAGELLIGGAGVVRGYLDRAELTAERFVDLPLGARVYRTGDLARFREDGAIEFLGRLDHQVKVRGYRIELGEIEATIGRHPAVQETVVVANTDKPGDPRLIAYVVPRSAADRSVTETWRTLWDETYRATAPVDGDAQFDVSGWNSSETGQALPAAQMKAWVDSTVTRIQELKPRRVLELGCGTGLLLFRLAPQCESYVGVDFAASALEKIGAELAKHPLPQVTLKEGSAVDLSGFQAGWFDTIVINSVAQYFPDVAYLEWVLKQAMTLLSPGGSVFLGDLRSLPLLNAFHASIELAQAEPSLTRDALRERVSKRSAQESELVIDPALFPALAAEIPELGEVEVRLKPGGEGNELTRFRYDVVLTKKRAIETAPAEVTALAAEPFALSAVHQALVAEPAILRVVGIPNRRVIRETALCAMLANAHGGQTAAELKASVSAPTAAFDPAELSAIDPRYHVAATWSAVGADRFDLILRHRSKPSRLPIDTVGAVRPWSEYANQPLRRGIL